MTERISDLQAYKLLRTLDRTSLAALPLSSYYVLLRRAAKLKQAGLVIQLVEDILELCPESERATAMASIMSTPVLSLLPSGTILSMLQCLHGSPEELDALSRPAVTREHSACDPNTAPPSLPTEGLDELQGDTVLTYSPPDLIHAAFGFVDRLLTLSQDQDALNVFKLLIDSGNIPSEAIQTIPDVNEFGPIIRSSLVRAGIHWHWRPLAEKLLTPLLQVAPSPNHSTISLTVDTIYGCLDTPTLSDLRACRSLICQIHPFNPVPNGIIRQFYNAAAAIKAGQEAHALYSFTRSDAVLKIHQYPCPQGSALPWLLRYLLQIHTHHAADLAKEILEGALPIPVDPALL
ncbi:hypothetical protein B0H10DRAFT_2216805 [Mycena sp. CBHHK59/15]|nr:hypothetical protein B0H10DRAFT_2216805 [Mycena sp. CBHHK59/15]